MPRLPSVAPRRARAPLLRQVTRLAAPVILSNLLQTMVNVVDVFLAGRLGAVPVAAVGLASSVTLLAILALQMVTAGAMALAAQARGAGDGRELSEVARQSIALAILAAIVLSAAGWLGARPLLAFMNSGGDATAVALGTGYLHILFAGTLFLALNLVVASLLQGAGDTLTPLLVGGAVNILNAFFDYLLMFGPGPLPALGVPGAAIGTVAAWALGAAIGVALVLRGRLVVRLAPGTLRPDLARFRDILRIGVPSGLQGTVYTVSRVVLLRIVTSTPAGTFGAAALAIGIQIESLAYMPGVAVSVAATSLVGRALGAWQVDEAWRRTRAALTLALAVMTSVAVVLFVGAPWWLRLFDPSSQATVIRAGVAYLRINALGQPALAYFMVMSGALRGAGDTRPALAATLAARWGVTLPLAAFLALASPLGVTGAWWAMTAGVVVQAAWVTIRWRSGAWIAVALASQRLYRLHLARLPEAERARFLAHVRAPLLARPGSREEVDARGVRYRLAEGEEVAVVFALGAAAGGIGIVDRHGHLGPEAWAGPGGPWAAAERHGEQRA